MQNIRLSGLIVLADWLETMVEDGKAIGIFDSGSGNRRKIAEELTSGLKDQGFKVDCLDVDEVDVDRLAEYDLLAVGGPTHMRKASRPMEEFLKKIENVDLKGKKAFASREVLLEGRMENRSRGIAVEMAKSL